MVEAGDAGAAAVSASAMVERSRALAGDAPASVLVVGADLRVASAAGASISGSGSIGALVGAPVGDLAEEPGERDRIVRAARQALAGKEGRLMLTGSERPIVAHFMPLHEAPGEEGRAAIALAPERPLDTELDELRTRAGDLETLGRAARSLARANSFEEVGGIVCEAASDVAAADVSMLLEPNAAGTELVVSASSGAELDGRTISLDGSTQAGLAFIEGKLVHSDDPSGAHGADSGPMPEAGALSSVWQPVRREPASRAVIAAGWRRPNQGLTDRLKAALGLLAGETAVAIDRAAALEHLTVLARTDPLTDLSNRRAWQDELARELARTQRAGQRLSIGLLDIDELKAFNDRWGHQAGDRLLLTAAARWRRRLRLSDLLARIGGDEFAVTLPGCDLAEAVRLGDQLRGALPDGLTCSIGVAEWAAGEPVESLLGRADRALYAAKGGGRDRTVAAPAASAAGA